MWNPEFSPIWVTLTSGERRQFRLERVHGDVEIWTWLTDYRCVPVVIAHRMFRRDPDEWRDDLQTALRNAMDHKGTGYSPSGLSPLHVR